MENGRTLLLMRGDEIIAGQDSPLRYQLASASKQFTAAALLLLVQQNRIRLDEELARWIPGWPGVTLHHLLTHTSGIGHWDEDYPMIDLDGPATREELVETFRSVPPLSPPGRRWRYSSPGYVLAAQVVEMVAGTTYARFLEERVFGPLGLGRTFAGAPGTRTGWVEGHDAEGRRLRSWDLDVTAMGAGDVWSTAGDMITWMDRLRGGALLDEPLRSLMLTERTPTGTGEAYSLGYGYGVYTGSWHGDAWFQHSGFNAGYKSFVACLPATERRLVILVNRESMDAEALFRLLDHLL